MFIYLIHICNKYINIFVYINMRLYLIHIFNTYMCNKYINIFVYICIYKCMQIYLIHILNMNVKFVYKYENKIHT